MRLTSLTLHGFKSFGDRTTVEFAPGITAIVGPNGSGKSNLIEALRWATGGGRASEYRAGEKTDLIFHGAALKRSVSYAEVALELHDGLRSHQIERSLLRDGSSRLRLDGRSARFLDVDERLSGTGLGKSGLAIVGQGEVGQVLMAGSDKLLEYVAEATGVARLSARRVQAESRLAAAQDHLRRLEDVLAGLSRQVEGLTAEAEEARRHEALSREALRLRYTLSLLRLAGLEQEAAALRSREGELTAALAAGRSSLAAAHQGWRAARTRAEALEADYRLYLTETESRRGAVRVAEERLKALRERQAATQSERQAVTRTLERLASQAAPRPPDEDPSELKPQLMTAAAAVISARQRLDEAEAASGGARAELERLRQAHAEAAQDGARYLAGRERLLEQRAALEARLEWRRAEAAPPLEPETAQVAALARRHAEAQDRLERGRRSLVEVQARHAEARAEAEARGRAAERARSAFLARRGYAQGPRSALISGLEGIHGSVADLVRAAPDLRRALSSALGRRAEYIVVDSAEVGERVIAHVRKLGGWVTVLPLELLERRRPSLPSAARGAPGVVGLLLELLEIEPLFERVFEQLLGTTVLVETTADAVALARREPKRPRLVTYEGDLVESYGAMSGGQRRGAPGGVGAAGDLVDAEEAARAAEYQAEAALNALRTLQDEVKTSLAEAQALGVGLISRRSDLERQEEARRLALSLFSELEQQLAGVAGHLAELTEPEINLAESDLAGAEVREGEAQRAALAWRAALAGGLEEEREARTRLALAEERWRQHQAACARHAANEAHQAELAERCAALEWTEAEVEVQLGASEAALAAATALVPGDLKERERGYLAAKEDSNEAEARLAPLSEKQAAQAEALETLKLTLARREAALELAQEEQRQFPPGLEALGLSLRSCRERLSAVEADLAAIGPVNHRAQLELEREAERLDALSAQHRESQDAVLELRLALDKIDRETTARLDRALLELRGRFQHNVCDLFGPEAQAEIVVERQEGRPQGLSIALQPPGKQTRSLALLSVGERTMGALAFLFSLMQGESGQGLPVAVLDEVDAPLDEANIRRFCNFLTRLAFRGTQFILITHQKATFDVADILWGVTSDRGVSRVFSIRREDYESVV